MAELLQKPRYVYFPYSAIKIALVPGDRAALHERIEQRFDDDAGDRARARGRAAARGIRSRADDAVDALRRLPPGLAASRTASSISTELREPRRRRDAPARQAPAHVAALDGRRDARSTASRTTWARGCSSTCGASSKRSLRASGTARMTATARSDGYRRATRLRKSAKPRFRQLVLVTPFAVHSYSSSFHFGLRRAARKREPRAHRPASSCAASRTTCPDAVERDRVAALEHELGIEVLQVRVHRGEPRRRGVETRRAPRPAAAARARRCSRSSAARSGRAAASSRAAPRTAQPCASK